ncbi:GH-E family nuclease [Paraclostridium ghonii]|uniref:GH-E family nuclease n=1 Tax=Paraclostridium ghonii TaxID=29358 RepID=UPI002545EC25|nr:GH-E family nuclease [Paeniclostridium ghonii]
MRKIQIDYGNTNNIINNLKNIVINLENEKRQIKNALNELYDLENYYYSKGEILRELEYRERQVSKDIEDTEILIENINAFSQKVKEVDERLASKFKQDVAKYEKENNIEITNELDAFLNKVQVALDVIGFIPVVGDICDGINGVISLARGDISGALISFVAMVPFIGDSVKGLKYMDKAAGLLKLGDKVVDIGKATAKVCDKKLVKLAKKETLEIISKGEKEFKKVLEATLDLGKNDYVVWIKDKGESLLNKVNNKLPESIQLCLKNGCLVGDTLVKTIDGLKFIKEIKVGDLVLSKNEETGLTEYKKVTEIHKNSTYESCIIKTENSIIEGTTGHLFMIKDKWWTPALEIKENDYIELSNGSYEKIIEVEYICREYPINTYNLTVEDNHNYYTGKDEALTHNTLLKKNCKNAIKKVTENKEVSYKRPSGFRKGVRDTVWDNAKNSNGDVIDPLTRKVMNKSEPWDMGHKPGFEFRKHKQSAKERGISRKEFLDEHNKPSHYRPELPSSNRSHKGEDLTDSYFGN